jgi:hypothetical protein
MRTRPTAAIAREIGFIPKGSTDSIALVVKNWTGIVGLDAAAFSGHSLRRGGDFRLTEEPRGICRARRAAAKPSAEGRPVTVGD